MVRDLFRRRTAYVVARDHRTRGPQMQAIRQDAGAETGPAILDTSAARDSSQRVPSGFVFGVCRAMALASDIARRRTHNSTRAGRVKWCMDNQIAP